MSKKLKPCPFCGGKAEYVVGPIQSWCQCEKCSATSEPKGNIEDAELAWNTRPSADRYREALEEILDRAVGCIEANDLAQYATWRENRTEGVKLNSKIKTAQTVINIAAAARAALEDSK